MSHFQLGFGNQEVESSDTAPRTKQRRPKMPAFEVPADLRQSGKALFIPFQFDPDTIATSIYICKHAYVYIVYIYVYEYVYIIYSRHKNT